MTAFADHLDLRTAVVETVRNADIVDVFPRLVKLAEAALNRKLRCREQIATDTLALSSGVAALPADFQAAIAVYNAAGVEYIAQPLTALKGHQERGYYGLSGSNLVAPVDETLTLEYYQKLDTIADSVTASNWLLQKHPALYLYAVSTEAAKYARDVEGASALAQLAEIELTAAAAEDAEQRYSRARVRVQGVTP